MSDLQDAIKRWDDNKGMLTSELNVIVDAARLVANLDLTQLEAVKHHLETYDLTLTKHDSVRFLAHGAQQFVDLAAALTEGDTKCPDCSGSGAGQVQTPWKTNPCERCDGTGDITEGDTQ